jgi:signal transduction histidine kinase
VSTSLRWRVLLGAFLWTAGLFTVSGLVLTALMLRHERAPIVVHGFFRHTTVALVMAVLCLAAGLWQVRRGLSPVNQLRSKLAEVHAGRARRLDGSYPAEVQPLVDDLNGLLQHQEHTVQRAVSKAGDLAHGLKTPLAVLAQEGERLEVEGHADLGATISEQVERMRRQIDRHLAHARAAASGATPGAHCNVRQSAEALARTLERLHASRAIDIRVETPQPHGVRVQREDLDEMLGNLLDNACKWAKSRVIVGSRTEGAEVLIEVDDDGPGIPAAQREPVLRRGVRADEAAPGSGLGLAIVRDLAELYGGSIRLEQSGAGGLRAKLRLPGTGERP